MDSNEYARSEDPVTGVKFFKQLLNISNGNSSPVPFPGQVDDKHYEVVDVVKNGFRQETMGRLTVLGSIACSDDYRTGTIVFSPGPGPVEAEFRTDPANTEEV